MDEVEDNDGGVLLSCALSVSEDNKDHQVQNHGSLARRPARAL
jgi:hypothetical protein